MSMTKDTARFTVNPALTGQAETGLILRPTCGSPPCGRYIVGAAIGRENMAR